MEIQNYGIVLQERQNYKTLLSAQERFQMFNSFIFGSVDQNNYLFLNEQENQTKRLFYTEIYLQLFGIQVIILIFPIQYSLAFYQTKFTLLKIFQIMINLSGQLEVKKGINSLYLSQKRNLFRNFGERNTINQKQLGK
ncbi:unnamed protein product [Paramecium sonneborni]|uniref:Transmembrane protein n=1 Tax=Paramecium sonneborni TaxID=65129 RepID=A0A8S1QXM1_9CILI|nr:unnamed protein product [Paramecium sonneborni]